MPKILSWSLGGLFLGMAFLLAVTFVKPIGVSTQFVIADAMIWDLIQPDIIVEDADSKSGYSSSNAYLNKSDGKNAKNAMEPFNYSFVFVISMMLGAWISSRLKGDRPNDAQKYMPEVWRTRFGDSVMRRNITVFFAGVLVLYGARLADGCTSGHMMSGMMQTAVSGYMFTLAAFVTGIPAAIVIFRKK